FNIHEMADDDLQSSLPVQSFDKLLTDRPKSPVLENTSSEESNNEIFEKPTYKKTKLSHKGSKNIKVEITYGICQITNNSKTKCSAQLKILGGSTSNLISHLTNIHGITPNGPKLRNNGLVQKETILVFVKIINNEIFLSSPNKSKSIFFAKSGSYPYTKSKNDKLTKALVKFFIQDAQPISLAVSPNFREFIKELDSMFSLPNEKRLDCSMKYSDESDYVNFETTDLVFNNNIEFVDAQEKNKGGPKDRKIKINAPIDVTNMQYKIKNALYNALLHYWDLSDNELFFACLLDPRFKKLRFATSTQQLQAKAAFREKYNNIKSLHQSPLTPINQSLDVYEEQPLAKNS
ncbi:30559_t:CDS:2, partial [Gigaspora margarita]